MDKNELLLLLDNAHLTPRELRLAQPALYSELEQKANTRIKDAWKGYLEPQDPDFSTAVENTAIQFDQGERGSLRSFMKDIQAGLQQTPQEDDSRRELIKDLNSRGGFQDPLKADTQIRRNIFLSRMLEHARIHQISDAAFLPPQKADILIQEADSVAGLTNSKIQDLVTTQQLTSIQGQRVGLATSIYELFDGNATLTTQVIAGPLPGVAGGQPTNLKSLASLSTTDWIGFFNQVQTTPPENLSLEKYARAISRKLEKLFRPTKLKEELKKIDLQALDNHIQALQPLYGNNDKVAGAGKWEDLDLTGISPALQNQIKPSFEAIKKVVNKYPGLEIDKPIDDPNTPPANTIVVVDDRVKLIDTLTELNPGKDFLTLDYSPGSDDLGGLDFGTMTPAEQTMVIELNKGIQRVDVLTPDLETTLTVVEGGYDSALTITNVTLDDFVTSTGIGIDEAKPIYEAANDQIVSTTAVLVSVSDILNGGFGDLPVGNTGDDLQDYLRDITGYDDLFGSQAYCKCDECASILGAAAYFVDLMYFVETNVLNKHFSGSDESHVLNLKIRRPDLWTLPLTCENTNSLIAWLDIVTEILENYIADQTGFTGDLNDRAAVESAVYKNVIEDAVNSFSQPVQLPQKELDTYLEHFEVTRGDIAEILEADARVIDGGYLKISGAEYDLITGENADQSFLEQIYGLTFTLTGTEIDPFDACELLKPMGLTRTELGQLVETNYVTVDGSITIEIKGEKTDSDSVQNDIERIYGLTLPALDRMHRFVRIWKLLDMTIPELDVFRQHLEEEALAIGIATDTMSALVRILKIQDELSISVEELITLWSNIPTQPVEEDKDGFFDRLFNLDEFVSLDGEYPKETTDFIHPAFRITTTTTVDNALHRLLAGLRVDDEQLYNLIVYLESPLGIDIDSTTESDRGFALSEDNLSLLYRHARLAPYLDLEIAELFQMIEFVADISVGYVETILDLEALLEFNDWWTESGYSLDELGLVSGGTILDEDAFDDPADLAASLLDKVTSADALTFASTVFAYLEDVTEEDSQAIIDANSTLIETNGDDTGYWLTSAYSPSGSATVPSGVSITSSEILEALASYHSSEVIPTYLAGILSLSSDQVKELSDLAGEDLGDASYGDELKEISSGAIEALIIKLQPLAVLFDSDTFDDDAIEFINTNKSLFDITTFTNLSIGQIIKIRLYQEFAEDLEDKTDLHSILTSFTSADKFTGADQDALAGLLDTEVGMISVIQEKVTLSDEALPALDKLSDSVLLAQVLGVSAEALLLMTSEDYDELAQASAAIFSAFRAQYDDEKDWEDQVEPYEDSIRNVKRDALTAYMIHTIGDPFESMNDLYYYFLVDPQWDGCARTSRVVAAISSVQLYVHRILMNLEQDSLEPDDPSRIHVLPEDIPADEWVWRKNFRVWQANRKVFLWPENWIEPELRDNKSPLFEELESDLLQNDIDSETVLNAYANYMRGFEDVANLKIAGSFLERDDDNREDILHLFGRTSDDPPRYYYRAVENFRNGPRYSDRETAWNPWQPIDVQIATKKVTPLIHLGKLFVFWIEVATKAITEMDEGDSEFIRYEHSISLKYTRMLLNGKWTAPQTVTMSDKGVYPYGDGLLYDIILSSYTYSTSETFYSAALYGKRENHDEILRHSSPAEGYTLGGPFFERVYAESHGDEGIQLFFHNNYLSSYVDLHKNRLVPADDEGQENYQTYSPFKIWSSKKVGSEIRFYLAWTGALMFNDYAYMSSILTDYRIDYLDHYWYYLDREDFTGTGSGFIPIPYATRLADVPDDAELDLINGSLNDVIIQLGNDVLVGQGSYSSALNFTFHRLGTTIQDDLAKTLFMQGVDAMLDIENQKELGEDDSPVDIHNYTTDNIVSGEIDYTGPMGVYYREVFFHIPFLIANHLNSQGKYESAQKWYHYIFNPTANEVIEFDPSWSDSEKERKLLDRNWRYLEFRDMDVQTLRDMLTDTAAIEAYKSDPFNPHAIARLRMSAYQKSIVMKYVDNLIDWGDSLFTEFTTESVNEAVLLYVMAQDILGEKPCELGDCGEAELDPKSYENIQPLLETDSQFLIELENIVYSHSIKATAQPEAEEQFTVEKWQFEAVKQDALFDQGINDVMWKTGTYTPPSGQSSSQNETGKKGGGLFKGLSKSGTKTKSWKQQDNGSMDRVFDYQSYDDKAFSKDPNFGLSITRQLSPVFCIPNNEKLLDYFDLVEDRLYKIRHCMDITGAKRALALFAPEIDPALLVRAAAAGLSIDEVLNATGGDLPPYRFTYLIQKAKSYAATVQSFGSALKAALERKDVEELALLRSQHQQNLLNFTTKLKEQELEVAQTSLQQLEKREASVQYRLDYFTGLADNGKNAWEVTQTVSKHTATSLLIVANVLAPLAAALDLLPEFGSPFAMKFGGKQLSDSLENWTQNANIASTLLNSIADSAGLEAGFNRRKEGWEHQIELATKELDQIEKQKEIADIRITMAEKAIEIHEKNIEQVEEVYDFFGDKFSSLGMYSWLSTTLQTLYRDAFNASNAMAQLAEQAYRFERNDNSSTLLSGDYWDSSYAGLLAGERLQMDLIEMEKRFIETNYRSLEIDQSFSLTQLSAAALITLKKTGSCTFSIPEFYFDVFYPGHYMRKIKAVRLTIPCITGPYTNVSATLSLVSSEIRTEAAFGTSAVSEIPRSRTVTIATSTAQSDSGVFDLNFRDDRYMPFEGAGAVSEWELKLPKTFRPFDYNTINDVIIHLSYTAEYDELFRDDVELASSAVVGSLNEYLDSNSLYRAISFRHEFSNEFHRLLHNAEATDVTIEIGNRHFPIYMQGQALTVNAAKLVLITADGTTPGSLDISMNGTSINTFVTDVNFGDRYAKDCSSAISTLVGEHTLSITDAGDLAPSSPPPSDPSALDDTLLIDIILYLEYGI